MSKKFKIGLVVPEIRLLGGIRKHAEFVLSVLHSLDDVEIELASLAMSSRDSCSIRLLHPPSWVRGVRCEPLEIGCQSWTHFGCAFSEIETQRFQKRAELTNFVQRQDLLAVVAGAPSWALPVCGLGVPVVLTFATLTSLERPAIVGRRLRPLDSYRSRMTKRVSSLDDRGIQASDQIVVENQIMYDYAAAIKGSGAVLHAPPGVDTGRFSPTKFRKFDQPYLLFVGRARDRRKNFGMLIAAYRDLVGRVPQVPKLVVAGTEYPDPSILASVPSGSVEVILNPSDSELASLYRGAVASVLTSDEEGFGFVVVEAMSSGVPVIATRCGGPEEIISNGVDGFLIACGDVGSLSNRLERLCTDQELNTSMGKKARAKIERHYSLEVTRALHRSVYERFLPNYNGPDSTCF